MNFYAIAEWGDQGVKLFEGFYSILDYINENKIITLIIPLNPFVRPKENTTIQAYLDLVKKLKLQEHFNIAFFVNCYMLDEEDT